MTAIGDSVSLSGDGTITKEGVVIPAGGALQINGGGWNSNYGLDYITFTKTADITSPTVTINSSKLASYSSSYTVTVPSDVVIYKAASPADGEVALTKVDGKVIPANTGVILYSETAGVKTLTYGGTEPTISGNILKNTASGAYTVQSTDNIYALVKGEQAIAKVDADVVIPANKAYLEYSGNAAKLSIVFDGTVTGINSVDADGHEGRALQSIYNLAGQRVSKSYKGVVVKGGKKFLQR